MTAQPPLSVQSEKFDRILQQIFRFFGFFRQVGNGADFYHRCQEQFFVYGDRLASTPALCLFVVRASLQLDFERLGDFVANEHKK
jgi:hypothetical protein